MKKPARPLLLAAVVFAVIGVWLLVPSEWSDRGRSVEIPGSSNAGNLPTPPVLSTPEVAPPDESGPTAEETWVPHPPQSVAPAPGPPASPDSGVLQHVLDRTTPTTVAEDVVDATVAATWEWYVADMGKARWTGLTLLAATAVTVPGEDSYDPRELVVIIQWNGTTPLGDVVDFRQTTFVIERSRNGAIDVVTTA